MYPKISVVIPTSGQSRFVNCTLRSIADQEGDFELEVLLILNNPSGCPPYFDEEACAEIKKLGAKVVVSMESKNASAARNLGLELATGTYVAFLDDDDFWPSKYIASRLKFILNNPEGIDGVYSGFSIVRSGVRNSVRKSKDFSEGQDVYEFLWGKTRGYAQTSGFFIKRECGLKTRWNEELARCQDHDFFIRFAKNFKWRHQISQLYYVRWLAREKRSFDFHSMKSFYDVHRHYMSDEAASGFLFDRMIEFSDSAMPYGYFLKEFKRRGRNVSLVKRLVAMDSRLLRLAIFVSSIFR